MNERKLIRVADVMKNDAHIIDGMDTIRDAIHLMKENQVKTLIVDRRHDDDEYGILLVADIARSVLAKDRAPERINVYEIMSKPVISVPPQMDIRYCARMFNQFQLTRAPVAEDGKIIGMVSFTDMVLKGLYDLY
ncbi:MAG TPA: CBS domain-containing protein [Acidiferrobacteraceae bacterium]|nr:CBS domain-containing protein [Acidiferrobacteraceae bacterium]